MSQSVEVTVLIVGWAAMMFLLRRWVGTSLHRSTMSRRTGAIVYAFGVATLPLGVVLFAPSTLPFVLFGSVLVFGVTAVGSYAIFRKLGVGE